MHAITFGSYVGVFTTAFLAYTYATVGGQYSVNVHFVPPLVTASCQIAQFWSPPNVTCALCFCMTGSLSRCIPQPGCRPNLQNATTTARPEGSTETSTPGDGTASDPDATGEPVIEAESTSTSSTVESVEGVVSKIRRAKPGKTRRRRHSSITQADPHLADKR